MKHWFNLHKANAPLSQVNVVLGNESADLDSTIGSLILAYLRFYGT